MEWSESESSSYGASRQSRYSSSATSEQKTIVDGTTVAASSNSSADAFTISGAISFAKPSFKKTAKGVTIERKLQG